MSQPAVIPLHLRPKTRAWARRIVDKFGIVPGSTELELLLQACYALDRAEEAREALAEAGSLTYLDGRGNPRTRPEVAIERDARNLFAKLVRQLNLEPEMLDAT